ncbi:hypothetical protein EDD99_7648 [Streptomyces sp. 846.5]|nr:cell division protein [Streptomyces sp. 846.5]TDT95811.1 hypothetical protein EDD99_7648 [Streptomyces sp. 846.5]
MSSQGGPASGGADGSWWDAVYEGPGDEVPDAPRADAGPGSVDDWFDSASGMLSGAAPSPPAAPPSAPRDASPEDAAPAGPPTLVDAPPQDAVPPKDAAEPPLPPLPVRPPRIPALKADPRVVPPPRAPADAVSDSQGAVTDESFDPYDPFDDIPDLPVPPLPSAAPNRPSAPPTVPRITVPAARPLPPRAGEQASDDEPEPAALPAADPDLLVGMVPDTALDGARYGTMTLRAASVRGDRARRRGEVRADRLLTLRFGEGSEALLLVVMATPPPEESPSVADDACRQLAASVGRSRSELLADLRVGAQERLRYGLQRLTARAAVRLQRVPESGSSTELSGTGGSLHALLAPLDPTSRLRAGFGLGPGGLLLLGDDAWYDAYAGRRLVGSQQPNGGGADKPAAPRSPDRFRFRVVVPEPGDVLLLCSEGLDQPLREEPAVSDFLADHWAHPHPPGQVDFLRQIQVRAEGYAADRTAAAIWED